MTTFRKRYGDLYTESKRVVRVDDEPVVKQVTCCCTMPAAKARECAEARGLKTRCRCFCHSNRIQEQKP